MQTDDKKGMRGADPALRVESSRTPLNYSSCLNPWPRIIPSVAWLGVEGTFYLAVCPRQKSHIGVNIHGLCEHKVQLVFQALDTAERSSIVMDSKATAPRNAGFTRLCITKEEGSRQKKTWTFFLLLQSHWSSAAEEQSWSPSATQIYNNHTHYWERDPI